MSTFTLNASPLREQFERDGFVIARHVIDLELVEEARAHINWLQEKHPDLRPEHLGNQLMTDDPFWVRLVGDDRLLDVAEQFIGPNIALFASHYIAKPPFTGQSVLWHQDGSYWPLDPMEVVTLWLALDDCDSENGCMRVIANSHHKALAALWERKDVDNVLGSSMDEATVDESRAQDIIMQAGDVEIHHPNAIHGSNANTSARWRRGLTIRYIPTSTRITVAGRWPSAFLLRGDAVPGANDYLPIPRFVEGRHMHYRGA